LMENSCTNHAIHCIQGGRPSSLLCLGNEAVPLHLRTTHYAAASNQPC
jgi:hypothetical protein